MEALECIVGEVEVTTRVDIGDEETNSEFAVDQNVDSATTPDVDEVSLVVGLMPTSFPFVVAIVALDAELNAGDVVLPSRGVDLMPSWWVAVKSASDPVRSTSILSLNSDFVFSSCWTWLIAEGNALKGPVSLLHGSPKSSWFSAWST